MILWMLIYLTLAVIYDWRDFRIPNRLNAAGAVITVIICALQGMEWSVMAVGVLIPFMCCIYHTSSVVCWTGGKPNISLISLSSSVSFSTSASVRASSWSRCSVRMLFVSSIQ